MSRRDVIFYLKSKKSFDKEFFPRISFPFLKEIEKRFCSGRKKRLRSKKMMTWIQLFFCFLIYKFIVTYILICWHHCIWLHIFSSFVFCKQYYVLMKCKRSAMINQHFHINFKANISKFHMKIHFLESILAVESIMACFWGVDKFI